jgi:hypothetical protein
MIRPSGISRMLGQHIVTKRPPAGRLKNGGLTSASPKKLLMITPELPANSPDVSPSECVMDTAFPS